MNEKNELIRLTLKNLETVESARKILEDADTHFSGQLDKFMEDRLEETFPELDRYCSFKDEKDLSFWSKEWVLPDEEGVAYYYIDAVSDDDLWWITCFVGKLNGSMGIKLNIEKIIRKKADRSSLLAEFYQQNEIALKKANFLFDGEKIYHPIELDLELLAESYPDYIAGEVFQPLEDALNDIKQVHHIFDKFVKTLIEHNK